MYTKGKQPYEGMRGDEVVTFIDNGMSFQNVYILFEITYLFKKSMLDI